MGIKENNLKEPDLGKIELKSQRRQATNPVTLFTLDKGVWQKPLANIIREYGYADRQGRLGFYSTVNSSPNSIDLYLTIDNGDLQLCHLDGKVLGRWTVHNLISAFSTKMPALVVVVADIRIGLAGREEFWFNTAYFLRNPNAHNFMNLVRTNRIVVDVRMHLEMHKVSVRNHGTAFRIDEHFLDQCFEKEKSFYE